MQVLNHKEAAKFLNVSESWLYKNLESAGVPHFKVGRVMRFEKDKLKAWMTQKTKRGANIK